MEAAWCRMQELIGCSCGARHGEKERTGHQACARRFAGIDVAEDLVKLILVDLHRSTDSFLSCMKHVRACIDPPDSFTPIRGP